MPEFSIRPFPREGESIQGYLLRVAKDNGRRNIAELLKVIGYRNNHNYQSLVGLKGILTETSSWYCRWSPEKIVRHFSENLSAFWLYQDKRKIENVVIIQPRFCIECFKSEDTSYFKFEWNLLHSSYCDRHNCPLTDTCPECGEQLQWHSTIFKQCTTCMFEWKNYQLPIAVPEDHFQSEFKALHEEEKKRWYEQFTHLVLKASRPYDLMHQGIPKLPKNLCHVNSLLSQAKKIQTGENVSANLTEWGPKGFIVPRRLKYEESIRFHQNFNSVAQALNISSNHISHLINQEILKPLDPLKVIHIMLFDGRSVQELLRRFTVIDKQTPNDVVIDETHKLLTCYYLTFGEFLSQALKYIEVRRFSDGLESIVIDKTLARKILFETMAAKLQTQHCTPYKIDRFLTTATRNLKVSDLLEAGLIEYAEGSNSIDGQSFLDYIEKHENQLKHRNKIMNVYL
jgi:hypothetical protein